MYKIRKLISKYNTIAKTAIVKKSQTSLVSNSFANRNELGYILYELVGGVVYSANLYQDNWIEPL